MGFWSSFFGHAAANAYNEMKKDERETQKWNDLFHELGEYETRFQNYLESIGCPDVYIADVEYVNSGNIIPAKREMDKLRRKCEEYISLGGQGKYLYRLEDIDEAIETIKYLKKMGCLHRQEEFVGLGMALVQDQLERELREDKGIQILLNSPNNELVEAISEDSIDFDQYDNVNESNVIIIDTAQVYDENIVEFLQFKTISIKFTSENICVYNYKEHSQIYYKTTINSSQKIDITITPIPAVEGWALIQINGLEVMFSLEKAEEVREFYREHNNCVEDLNNQVKKVIEEDVIIQESNDDLVNNLEEFSIDGVRFWNSDEERFLDMDIRCYFSTTRFSMFVPLLNKELFATDFEYGTRIETEVIESPSVGSSILRFTKSLILLMSTEDANRVKEYYDSYEEMLEKDAERKQKRVDEILLKIDGINDIAMNMLNMTDEHILLNHDTVICLQVLLAYKKYTNVKLWDEESTSNENTLLGVAVIKQSLDNMVEVIQENYADYSEEDLRAVCWEAVKRASVKFYSEMWQERYGKYIDEPLKQNELTEADGTLDKYIEEVIRCNEIDDTDVWVMGLFTYYFMDKGYATGELYFPPYYEIAIQAFDTIRDNMKKKQYKEKLKGTVKKQVTHYTIDDIDMMNGSEFEYFICELYIKMGYKAEVTKQSGDQGLDVIAEKGDKRVGIQVKCYSNTVGNSAVQEAVAGKSFYHCDKVVVVTNNYFTSSAIELAQANDVILWNRDLLKEKIKELM